VTLRTNNQQLGNRAFPSAGSISLEDPSSGLSLSSPRQRKGAGVSIRSVAVSCIAAFSVFFLLGGMARAADSNWREVKSEPGLSYKNEKVASEPWSIHVLKIDRSQKDLMFYSAHARDKVLGVSLIAQQARAIRPELGRAIAGVNGDFYLRDNPPYSGDPRGLQIMNGELISGPDTVCVWFDADGNPHLDEVKGDFQITWPDGKKTPFGLNQQRPSRMAVLYTPTYGASTLARGGRELVLERAGDSPWLPLQASQTYRASMREVQTNGNTRFSPDVMVLSLGPQLLASLPELAPGMKLEISTATTPDLKGAKAAIGGGPTLVKDGKSAFTSKTPPPGTSGDWSQRSKYERHPRTAVGWSKTHVYFVIVDGRQPGLSVGMKLFELADYFLSLSCSEAMNLDGGKSAQMWMTGRIMNDPCQGEDTVASSLLVVRKPEGR
jgi:hypothetical protein